MGRVRGDLLRVNRSAVEAGAVSGTTWAAGSGQLATQVGHASADGAETAHHGGYRMARQGSRFLF
jgi:hypothetical protein